MKALLKTGIFFMLISVFTVSLYAQDRGEKKISPEERAVKQTERMTKHLELNADQQAKVKAIHVKYNKEMKAKGEEARTKAKKDKETRRAEMKKKHEAKEAELKSVLTPEQYEKWQIKQKDNKKGERKHKVKKGNEKNKERKVQKQDKK